MLRLSYSIDRRLAGLACLTLLASLSALAGEPTVDTLAAGDRACVSASECTVVMTACCACTLAAVSRDREKAVRSRIKTELACDEVCPISCEAPPVACEKGLCELLPPE